MQDFYTDLYESAPWRTPGNPEIGTFILDNMLENGWCPFDVNIIDNTIGCVGFLYYLGRLPPPRSNSDHSKCSKESCIRMTIDSSYVISHATPDCSCNEEFSDVSTVIEILDGMKFPSSKLQKNTIALLKTMVHLFESSAAIEAITSPSRTSGPKGWETLTAMPSQPVLSSGFPNSSTTYYPSI